jgi:intracellular multiplication protein IcmO
MLRGLEQRQEQDPSQLIRDTRTLSQRTADFFKTPAYVTITLMALAIASYVLPGISDIIALTGIGCFWYAVTRKSTLPFKLPQRSGQLDYNDLKPNSHQAKKASGIYFFGNEKNTNEELWFSNEDMRTHCLIFGSTGSGKTETLISLAYNALVQGSGFIYVDGKGDNSLFARLFSMVRSMGREDDMLVVNFMTGARDIVGPQEKRLSNTMNPFANGSSSMLAELVVSLMDSSSNTPDGDMWKGRAIVFVQALMKILTYMRDQGALLLDVNVVRNYFELARLESIVVDKQFPRDNAEPVSLADAPPVVLEPIANYVTNLPGYDKTKKGKQVSQVLEQHGFITMQLTKVFGSLADTYGHIMRTNLAEVDLKDVVLNRRVLVVLLPAFEKSPEELSNLGKIIVASLKAMLAAGLGEDVEGEYRDVVQRKPTNAPTPYLCILDEYGYYAVPGFAVVPAQARSLGFSLVFAGQDLPAFQKASKEEALSIGANTNIKICMKLEDPMETWEFFQKSAGEAYVTKVDSFQTRPETVMNMYSDTRTASAEKRARIDLLDLKDQGPGEMHIFFKSKIVRARTFYADPKPVARMRLNQLLKVEPPPGRILGDLARRLDHFQQVIDGGQFFTQTHVEGEEVALIANALQENTFLDPIEAGVSALLVVHNQGQSEVTTESEEEGLMEGELDVFTRLQASDEMRQQLRVDDYEKFSMSLLNRSTTRDQVAVVERLAGKPEKHASNIADEIVKDIRIATHYPPLVLDIPSGYELADVVNELSGRIISERERKAAAAAEQPPAS